MSHIIPRLELLARLLEVVLVFLGMIVGPFDKWGRGYIPVIPFLHQVVQSEQLELLALFVVLPACSLTICARVGEAEGEEGRGRSRPSRTVAPPRSVGARTRFGKHKNIITRRVGYAANNAGWRGRFMLTPLRNRVTNSTNFNETF